ncbi:hypothetical protein GCM10010412_082620 [Nonomuraea recticatena]|uniref:Uncharacterized protein n=1 Tax=Nonomuraea recticatena TaxID=46178 RepID=A0ABP6FJV3_9ACTN
MHIAPIPVPWRRGRRLIVRGWVDHEEHSTEKKEAKDKRQPRDSLPEPEDSCGAQQYDGDTYEPPACTAELLCRAFRFL